jgi:predicted ester cyclase/ketosteroid isomerase-like protein
MRRIGLCGLLVAATSLTAACKKDKEDKEAAAGKTKAATTSEGTTQTAEGKKGLTPEEQIKKIEGCWAALAAWDKDTVRSCYPDKIEFINVDSVPPQDAKTQQEAVVHLGAFRNAFPDFKADLELVLLNGHKSVAVGRLSGTHKGRSLGIAPTNRPVSLLEGAVTELDDEGRYARQRNYVDQMTIFNQLGLEESAMAPTKEQPWPEQVRAVSKGDATEKANLDAFKAGVEAGNKEDLAGWMARYADDATLRFAAIGQEVKGKQSIEAVNKAYFAQHDQLEFTVRDAWAAGDWVMAETNIKGSLAADLPGVKGSKGKKWEQAQLELAQFAGGKVKRHIVMSNYLKFYVDVGIIDPESIGAQ